MALEHVGETFPSAKRNKKIIQKGTCNELANKKKINLQDPVLGIKYSIQLKREKRALLKLFEKT